MWDWNNKESCKLNAACFNECRFQDTNIWSESCETFLVANFSVSLKCSALKFLTRNGANLAQSNFGCYFHLELLRPLPPCLPKLCLSKQFQDPPFAKRLTEAADLYVLWLCWGALIHTTVHFSTGKLHC